MKILRQIIWFLAIGIVFAAIGAIALSTIGSILYAIYLWGGLGLPLSAAVWGGAQVWITIIVVGIPTAIVAYLIALATER
jgi:hypothetical protein